MCCLFGLLDYNNVFSGIDKKDIISVLSTESESRGNDATGISYNANKKLCIFKRPLPAHKLQFFIPNSARFIMGHTRMTTQGSEKLGVNNHPFPGLVQTGMFALAHNGVIYNDVILRQSEALPETKIQTDSYIAVQLIEKQNALNFGSLKYMAEKVEGSFCFTVLDISNNLYIVKGNNPLCLYEFTKYGFYLYASTNDILSKALAKLGLSKLKKDETVLSHGDILKIDRYGKQKRSKFDTPENPYNFGDNRHLLYSRHSKLYTNSKDSSYLQELKSVAFYYGYSSSEIDTLLEDGFSCEEIEDMFYFKQYSKESMWD